MKKSARKAKISKKTRKEESYRVAINGFGRIGKQFFLACMEKAPDWDIVINHSADLDFIVYTLKYDSVHPTPEIAITHDGRNLLFGDRKFKVFNEMDPEKLPWKAEKIDLVIECTGNFTARHEAMKHIKAGAGKVLISAPAKEQDVTIVPGVNDAILNANHRIISAGSCTTNCVAPMVKILHDAYRVKNAFFVTTHAYTSTQRLIDGVDRKDLRRGRAAAADIVPSTSGAAISVVEAIPELKGKLDGYALRVPVVDGSISTIVAQVDYPPAAAKDVNALFKKKTQSDYREILQYTDDPIVSSDIIHNPASCIIDAGLTSMNGNVISIAGWYDNEWGYSNRLVDLAKMILHKK
jgi:glyceraldehyde 3-phosphate dehydrogenase